MNINNKYVGESAISKIPEKALTFRLKDGSVTSDKIAKFAITIDKLAPEVLSSIGGGSLMVDVLRKAIETFGEIPSHTVSFATYSTLVGVGDAIDYPTINTKYHDDIKPVSGEKEITVKDKYLIKGKDNISWGQKATWENTDIKCINKYTFKYSYPDGKYLNISNLGFVREDKVKGVTDEILESENIKVVYPCYIDSTKYLVDNVNVITNSYTQYPVVKIHKSYYTVKFEVEAMGGFLPSSVFTDIITEDNGYIIYKASKDAAALTSSTKFRITFNSIN